MSCPRPLCCIDAQREINKVVAILGGVTHPVGAFIGAAIFEFVKLFAAAYLTGAWQMVLGFVLIAMVFLAPRGVSALLETKRRDA